MSSKIADVAERAGVSTATVSRVLADKPHVRDETRQRVLTAIQDLGYRPSRVARSLRSQRAAIIGLIVSDIQNPFFTAIVRGVEDIAYGRQYGVFLCNSDEDPDKEALYIDLMLAEHVSGVIISPTTAGACHYQRLLDAGTPLVAVDRRLADAEVDTVVVNNAATAHRLVTWLVQEGHERIGAVIGSDLATTGTERLAGYEHALRDHDLPIEPELIRTGLPKRDIGYDLTNDLLSLSSPPTAIFAGNNLLTLGVLGALHDQGLIVGRDMALAAFDHMDWMDMLDPPLTVAAQPTYEMGRQAGELLFRRMQEPRRPIREVVLNARIYGGVNVGHGEVV